MLSATTDTALVFDVQRFSIHDGPGIRTLVFFKGCSLNCSWCQNPEAGDPTPEIAFYADRCRGCAHCAKACRDDAIDLEGDYRIVWDRCTACGACAEACPENALRLIGDTYTVADVAEECLRDKAFYDTSGGGVTFSGGEPVLQSRFLQRLLPQLKENGIHLMLETAGNYPFDMLAPLLPHLDAIYYDYKVPGPEAYKTHTGSDDARIRENLKRLLAAPIPIRVRIPLVPGINTDPEQIDAMSAILAELGVNEVSLLKYNHLWEAKLPRLHTRQHALGLSPDDINYDACRERFKHRGIKAAFD